MSSPEGHLALSPSVLDSDLRPRCCKPCQSCDCCGLSWYPQGLGDAGAVCTGFCSAFGREASMYTEQSGCPPATGVVGSNAASGNMKGFMASWCCAPGHVAIKVFG